MTEPPADPESTPPPEQPSEPAFEAPPQAPRRTVRPPLWPYFLTPIAVLIGAAAIVVTIILLDDDPPPAEPIGPALESLSEAVESLADASEDIRAAAEAAQPASAPEPVTLRGTLEGYAAALDLDATAFGACLGNSATLDTVGHQLQRGLDLGVNGTPAFFVNNKYISGAQPSGVFTEVIAAELAGSPTTIEEYSEPIQVLANREPPAFAILDRAPDFSNAPIKGSPDATVVIVEFSDFQCPFCQRWYLNTLPEIERQIGDDVALVFLHFPITQLHPNAPTAHAAAECAGEQGKFWEMHDLLFETQDEWSRLPNPN